MKTETQHTPTPWHINDNIGFIIRGEAEPRGKGFTIQIANCDHPNRGEGKANAAFIVQAVNAHADLITALEYTENELEHLKSGHVASHNIIIALDKIRAALAKAKEVTHD